MRVLLPLALLSACAPEEGPEPPDRWVAEGAGAPPAALALDVPELRPGAPAEATVADATPGATVYLVAGAAGDGPCPPLLDGGCLGVRRPDVVATAVADDAGVAVFALPVPADAPLGDGPTLQAVTRTPALSTPVPTHLVHADAKPDFSLVDLNDTSLTFDTPVSPRDYLAKVSGWYFGHAT